MHIQIMVLMIPRLKNKRHLHTFRHIFIQINVKFGLNITFTLFVRVTSSLCNIVLANVKNVPKIQVFEAANLMSDG